MSAVGEPGPLDAEDPDAEDRDAEDYDWSDPGTDMPVELLALSDQELEEVYAAAQVLPVPARPIPPSWPLSYRTAHLPDPPAGLEERTGGRGETEPRLGCGALPDEVPIGFAEGLDEAPVGFAEGGVLDGAPGGITLAEFADDAYAELAAVDDDSLIGLMRGWRRITSWAQARELAVVAELARRRPADGYPPAPPEEMPAKLSEFVAEEIAPPLTLTSRAADAELALALDLASHPMTAAALETGQIDMPKALIILGMLAPLDPSHAAAIEAAILAVAEELTTGQLRARLQRLVLSVDPDAARRRREKAEQQARVECWTDPEGTATLAGRYLPPAQVLVADRRLCAIAMAWKKLGAQGGMDLFRAHAYLALLLGRDTSVPPPSLLPQPQSQPQPQPPPSGAAPDDPGGPGGPGDPGGPGGPGALPPLVGSVHLTIPLFTLLGLADRPGEAAGFGPLDADTCRMLADAMAGHRATRWGVIITDPDGRAMGLGGPVLARRTGRWTVTLTTEPIAPYP